MPAKPLCPILKNKLCPKEILDTIAQTIHLRCARFFPDLTWALFPQQDLLCAPPQGIHQVHSAPNCGIDTLDIPAYSTPPEQSFLLAPRSDLAKKASDSSSCITGEDVHSIAKEDTEEIRHAQFLFCGQICFQILLPGAIQHPPKAHAPCVPGFG